MKKYPVSIPVTRPKKLEGAKAIEFQMHVQQVRQIELYLNEEMNNVQKGEQGVFMYYDIAKALGLQKETVKKILYAYDCGSNGITITK